MTPTELEEAVAEAMELCPNSSEHMARAAIRVVIEAAAKVADMFEEENFFLASQTILKQPSQEAMMDGNMKTSSAHTAQHIAAAIRRLAGEKND